MVASLTQKVRSETMSRSTTSAGCLGADELFFGSAAASTQELSQWATGTGVAEREVSQHKVACCDACQQRPVREHGPLGLRPDRAADPADGEYSITSVMRW